MKQYIFLNGFGRIARCIFRCLFMDYNDMEVVAINDPYISLENAIYLLKYDSIFGEFSAQVTSAGNNLVVSEGGKIWRIKYFCEKDNFDFGDDDELVMIDASDVKYNIEDYLSLKFKKIFLTKWLNEADKILIEGKPILNNRERNKVISCGICDTVGIVPFLAKFNQDDIKSIVITTLHPFLGYQNVLDGPPRDVKHTNYPNFQLGRSALNSIIPKKSSVKEILLNIFPEYRGRLSFMTYRIPTDLVTACDITILFEDSVTKSKLKAMKASLLNNTDFPLVSKDFTTSKESYNCDSNWYELDHHIMHFTLWYNNELGYSSTICKLMYKELFV